MADKETDLKIGVKAVPNEKSAEQTVNKLADGVEKASKKGRIKVPVSINTLIDNKDTESKLSKAQKDVVKAINKMSKKGFSASAKDIDALNSKMTEFTHQMDQAGKGHQNKVFREIRKQVDELNKSYKALQLDTKSARVRDTKTSRSNSKPRRKQDKFNPDSGPVSDESIEASTRQPQKRQLKGIGSVLPKKYGSGWVDSSRTNEYEVKKSEVSFYPSNMARQFMQSRREARKWEKESLVVDKYVTKEELDTELKKRRKEDKKLKQSSRETKVVKENGNFIPKDIITTWETSWKTVARNLSPQEKASRLSEDLRKRLLPDLLNKIKESENDKDTETLFNKFFDTLDTISELNLDAGKLISSDIKKDIGLIMSNLGFSTTGNIGGTEGGDKTEISKDPKMVALLKGIFSKIENKEDAIKKELIKLSALEKSSKSSKLTKEKNNYANKLIAETHANNEIQKQSSKATETQTNYDRIEAARESVADTKLEDTEKTDAEDGMNSESNTMNITRLLSTISNDVKSIVDELTGIVPPDIDKTVKTTIENSNLPDLYRYFEDGKWITAGVIDKTEKIDKTESKEKELKLPSQSQWNTAYKHNKKYRRKRYNDPDEIARIEKERAQIEKGEHPSQQRSTATPLSGYISSIFPEKGILDAIKKAFGKAEPEINRVLAMNQEEQEKLRAQHIAQFGLSDVGYTGDKIRLNRIADLWNNRKGKPQGVNPFSDLQLTEGIGIDAKAITSALQTAIQKNMFNAQTGGALRNLFGSMSFYAGMPSLEKSRAEAEAANEIMKIIRDAAMDLLRDVQAKETDLRGMEASGQAKFDKTTGRLIEGSSEAVTTFAEMESLKQKLRGVLAEANMIDSIAESTKGNVSELLQKLGFAAPELRQCNKILQNIHSGLNKDGKALKFQTRTAEVLNYSFQLMARHVGQIWKGWIMQLNPLAQIKKLFADFASYNTKWQRTMNVIKYNLRRIVRPMMEWIAQQLVNMIGLVNALIKGIGKAFGKDWDLFDQSAANAEKMKEELEAAANVTAGFDELHDIGSDNTGANDLMGDIYTPQWEGLNKILEKVGETIGKLFAFVKGLNFWQWLALAGTALVGFLALKWLINLFSNKNPLENVAKGFSFLEKAVGWAILIWAFTEFTKALTNFVECMKSANRKDIIKSLVMLGGAFAALVGAILILEKISNVIGTSASEMAGLAALVGVFGLFVKVLTPFIECIKDIEGDKWELLGDVFKALALGFLELITAVAGAELVTSVIGKFIGLDWTSMLGLAAVVVVFDLFVAALTPFIKALKGMTADELQQGIAFLAEALGILVLTITAFSLVMAALGPALEPAIPAILAIGVAFGIVIAALSLLVLALHDSGDDIKLTLEGISEIVTSVINGIATVIETVGNSIVRIITAVANGIKTVLQPIMYFLDSIIDKVLSLAVTIVREIGGTIRSIVNTVGNIIVRIIEEIANLIPNLLKAILNFCAKIGPAIENSVNAIIRTITKLINFMISGIEYAVNTLVIGSINSLISSATFGMVNSAIGNVAIPRFIPQYKQGTNYVPNDGLAYLHQGEAVVPKKYNQPINTGLTTEEREYMQQMIQTMNRLDSTISQGINVSGEFRQRGSDLVATVEKNKNKQSNNVLNNKVYAR